MLIGQYEGRVGQKHQLSLPKKFREIVGEKLIVTKGFENCLIIVSEQGWKTLLEGTEGMPFTNKSTRQLQRFLLGNASYIELDSKGRFVLPEYLRFFASLNSEVVFAGIQRFIEVWDKKLWDENQDELGRNLDTISQRLSAGTGEDG